MCAILCSRTHIMCLCINTEFFFLFTTHEKDIHLSNDCRFYFENFVRKKNSSEIVIGVWHF